MFESFYGLTANPFRMSADEQFRFVHKAYKKAWAYLKYALDKGEGFVLITGRPGTGKTTLIRDTLTELDSEGIVPVNLVSNQLQGEELLRLVALELGLQAQDFDKATLLTRIEQYTLMLHQEQRRVVVIVDEAQNLSPNGLEELRLLSNLQVGNQPLFQIFLIGQEELRSLIYGQAQENIMQRIVASCILEPMSSDFVQGYVEHRLGIVGWDADPTFDPAIFESIHYITHGVPRDINLVMARLLLFGALEEKHQLTQADLITVLRELGAEQRLAVDQVALIDDLSEAESAEAETVEAETVEAEAVETESVEAEAVEADAVETDTVEAETVEAETVEAEAVEAEAAETEYLTTERALPNESVEAIPTFCEEETQWGKSHQHEDGLRGFSEPDESEASCPMFSSTFDADRAWADTEPVGDEMDESPPQSTTNEPALTTTGEPSFSDELPELRIAPDADGDKHLGLLTDADELLGVQQEESSDSSVWRWFFYPVAIAMLVIAILAVRYPDDADYYWNQFQQRVGLYIEGLGDGSTQSPAESQKESGDESAQDEREAVATTDAEGADQLTQTSGEASGKETNSILPEPKPKPEPASKSESVPKPVARQQTRQEPPKPNYLLSIDQETGELAGQSKPVFAQLMQRLHSEPSRFVVLTGVSDSRTGSLTGMRDALKQAVLISDLLVEQGIEQSRIAIEGRSSVQIGRSHTVEVKLRP